jgi:hypothetical protein
MDPLMEWVHTSRDVIFNESRGWDWSTKTSSGESVARQEFMVKYYTMCMLVDDVEGAPPGGAPELLAAQDAPQPELEMPPPQG